MIAAAALLFLAALPAAAQENPSWNAQDYRSGGNSYSNSGGTYGGGGGGSYPAPNESYGSNGSGGYPSSSGGYGNDSGAYAKSGGYGGGAGYSQNGGNYGSNDAHSPNGNNYGANDAYSPSRNSYGNGDAYSPSAHNGYGAGGDAYSPARHGGSDRYTEPGQPTDPGGYGEPYAAPPAEGAPPPYAEGPPRDNRSYSQNEIIAAGHGFFGAISQSLAQAVEYAFKSEGRPNGYILGEDAGGAFVVGLRYGEGRLYTKDAGDHKVFWQGPSLGYDAGAEGSKAMVLVYNLRDPSEIYNRFGGVQGSAYLVGGLSVQFQKYGDVTLAVIRSGVGVRLGANVGYLKYTRAPTWNPL